MGRGRKAPAGGAEDPNDPFVARNRAAIVKHVDIVRTHLGMLEINGRPAGAEVEVAGQPVGRFPLRGPLRVPTGEINIRVAAPGYRTERRDVEIQTAQMRTVTFELLPQSAVLFEPAAANPSPGGYVPSAAALRSRSSRCSAAIPLRQRARGRRPAPGSARRRRWPGWVSASWP